jgi:hypothetical protein
MDLVVGRRPLRLRAFEKAGLVVSGFHEHAWNVYRQFPSMQRDEAGRWRLAEGRKSIPLMFELKAFFASS